MALSSKILCIKKHNMNMDILWIKNSEKPKGPNADDKNKDISFKISEVLGDAIPIVNVNGYIFDGTEIRRLELIEGGKIPTIRAVISDDTGAFTNKYFPTSKSIMMVYVKAQNKNLKAIRCDFLITDIKGVITQNPDGNNEGRGTIYTFTGILNVPSLTSTTIKARTGSSFDVMLNVSGEMNLGFATNELSTNDTMTWIQPNTTYSEYIDSVTSHAYSDDNSFYTSYIDRYYNLTFINVYNMMAEDSDFDAAYYVSTRNHEKWFNSGGNNETTDSKSDTVPNQLTNQSDMRGSLSYISSYSIKSNQGKILLTVPSRERIYYYDNNISDIPSEKFVDYEIMSHDTMKSEEEINNNVTNEWFGIDTGNIHDNYFFASKMNFRNNIEMSKTNLVVEIQGVNLNLLRGMRVPVNIWKEGFAHELKEDTSDQETLDPNEQNAKNSSENLQMVLDKKLSGSYIVNNLKFVFDAMQNGSTRWSTEVILSRASWGKNTAKSN